MFAKTFSSCIQTIEGLVVSVEASRQNSTPQIHITGLPGDIVKESRERIKACLHGMGIDAPRSRTLVHLHPANAKKQGSQLDLAIALSILGSDGLIPAKSLGTRGFLGELTLDGQLLRVGNLLPLVHALLARKNIEEVIIPKVQAFEASMLRDERILLASQFSEVLDYLLGKTLLTKCPQLEEKANEGKPETTLDDIVGQGMAKRGLLISLAGRHHFLMVGPPGVGKTLLASTSQNLLPRLTQGEAVELAKIYGHRGLSRENLWEAPFRSPHHSISGAGLLGGGTQTVSPGEVSLSHQGVLFLDELPEFRRDCIEGLREPLQSGEIFINRQGHSLHLPANFVLLAAMNPCPCGFSLSKGNRCYCPPPQIAKYRRKVSGALLDRVELMVALTEPQDTDAGSNQKKPIHQHFKERISQVRDKQKSKKQKPVKLQENLTGLDPQCRQWIQDRTTRNRLSFRALNGLLRVAQTIADLEGCDDIRLEHLNEAWAFRVSQQWPRF